MEVLKKTFIAPSGFEYTIREENGADEEIISNVQAIQDFMNLTNFISSIVVNTNITKSGKLTPKEALHLPLLDRYAILVYNRIFSLGPDLDFTYKWPNGNVVNYGLDLTELIFSDYTNITQEEQQAKPDAVPGFSKEILDILHKPTEGNLNVNLAYELQLSSGKKVRFNLLNGVAERYMAKLTPKKQTRNSILLARNLQVEVEGQWNKVESFAFFSIKELAEIHKKINDLDPTWEGTTEIEDPSTGQKELYPVLSAPHFFFLTEA